MDDNNNETAENGGVSICNAVEDSPWVRKVVRKSYQELDAKCKRAKSLMQVSKELLTINQRKNKTALAYNICHSHT